MEESQLPRSDHDLLITLAANTRSGIADLKTDIADLKSNISELKGSFSAQYIGLDSRLKTVENVHAAVNPLELKKMTNEHEEFINEYRATHKERNAIWALWASVISLLLAGISAISNLFRLHL